MDTDIRHSFEDLKIAEGIVGHKWTSMGTDENKEKYKNPAKKILYNFDPELDATIKDSLTNLSNTEKKLKTQYHLEGVSE